jgi:predicted RNA-binding protein
MEVEFFWNLYNNETQREEMLYKETEPYIEVPTSSDVFEVIKDLNTYKAREEESNCAELVKYGRL